MKKGQLFDSAVSYMMVAVIVIAVVAIGWKGFTSSKERHQSTAALEFQSQLDANIDRVTRKKGTVETVTLQIPGDVEQICFFDETSSYLLPSDEYPKILDEMIDGGENVFLITSEGLPEGISTRDLRAGKNMLCVDTPHSTLDLQLEGGGTYAVVREA